ncbi:cytochrome P450 4A4-like [Mya arenaria]|uniref:cytochrome P450 4A4-like n=1 Tax=Mya arenaria TaxID=6604 RepID=UPI0022E91C7F|nr:cytochrome P450 4A4-like [Mya arenaria]
MGLLVTLVMKYLPLVLGFLIGKTIIKLVLRRWELQKIFKAFSGPKPHFLWGNTKELFGDYQGLVRMAELAHVYSGAYPAWTGPADAQLVIVTSGTTRAVLAGADPKDEFSNSLLGPWIGDGLLLSHGKKWERTRRLLTPAFHSDNLKNYIKTFEECSKELVKKWQHSTEPEEVFQHVSLLTLDIIMQCLFGFHSNCQSGSVLHPYIQGVYDVSELVAKRVVNPLYHYKFIYKLSGNGKRFQAACDAIHEHSERIIRERRSLIASEKPGTRNMDFLDVLLTAKDRDDVSLSDKEIRDEVNTFIFEGHESTASTITWFLYNMAKHPEYQNKCREEILEVIGKDKEITWNNINKLSFTEMCISESMRLYPAVPLISRCLGQDTTLPDGRVVPKGVGVSVSLFAVHRDPEVWENPHEYDPERFHPDKRVSSLIHMPFSTGPRKCIGMQFALTQVKVVACEILRNFHIDLDPPHEATPESILFLRSKSGVYLKFIKLPVEGVPIL